MKNSNIKRIAILASGSGTNAENFIRYFKSNKNVKIDVILSNKNDAYVLERAKKLNVDTLVFNRQSFYETENILNFLLERQIDLIVLAGFLWLIPENLIKVYDQKIINIHPALLPKYGGKGMYGRRVHETVIENKEKESGITIHFVNSKYDEGKIIHQAKVNVEMNDTPDTLAKKIHALEYEWFPKIVEQILNDY